MLSNQIVRISTSTTCNLIQKFRKERGLPLNPNACGPLTDLPDYTFLDGRPTPLGTRQNNRMLKQKQIAERILTLSKEIDYAVKRHQDMLNKEEEKKQQIIANKFKPKGHLLLKDN